MWLHLFALLLSVGRSDMSEAHTLSVQESESFVIAIDKLCAGSVHSEAAYRLPRWARGPVVRYHQLEIGTCRHRDHDFLARGNDVEPGINVSDANGHTQGRLASNINNGKLFGAMRALPSSHRKERTRKADFPLPLNNANISNQGGCDCEQDGNYWAVIHNEKSKPFDGKISTGELLAIKLLLVACLGGTVGIAAAVLTHLADTWVVRIAAAGVALAAIAMLWALIGSIHLIAAPQHTAGQRHPSDWRVRADGR